MLGTKPKPRKEEGMKGYALGKKFYFGFVVLLTIFLTFSGILLQRPKRSQSGLGRLAD